ncbi:hypothetical protein [Pontibacter sp. G13]|uniref:hypothetical protein n=1 Tax=Pontibacter sp. G13 TaxID=3074898 RepID=UPI00288A7BD6|nr:hypothetical protein [Pontibacter sp. G13]WNJ19427.1 hypothetical protein RJD25_02950 [Pontibacter sp. G13]
MMGSAVLGQGRSDLSEILTACLQYPCLEDFWDRDSTGSPLVNGWTSTTKLPSNLPIWWNGQWLMPAGLDSTHVIAFSQCKLKPGKANVKFQYHEGMTAKFKLMRSGDGWKIRHAHIKRKVLQPSGKTRMQRCWETHSG